MVFLRPVRTDLRVHWRRLAAVGSLQLMAAEFVFFCAALSPAPPAAGLLGAILLCMGVLSLSSAICPMLWPGSVAQNAIAAACALAGLWLMLGPPAHLQVVAIALAVCLLAGGFHRFTGACSRRGLHWRWTALYGCASLALGLLLLLAAPHIGMVRFGTILGTEFALGAATWLGYAWMGWRNYQRDAVPVRLQRPSRMSSY